MEQIFLNLIVNAAQALDKKSGVIRIEAREKRDKVELRITDTGPGIPPEIAERIFEPFFTRPRILALVSVFTSRNSWSKEMEEKSLSRVSLGEEQHSS